MNVAVSKEETQFCKIGGWSLKGQAKPRDNVVLEYPNSIMLARLHEGAERRLHGPCGAPGDTAAA